MVGEEEDLCVVCLDETPTVILEACKHKCMCQACFDLLLQRPALKVHTCPLCRVDIAESEYLEILFKDVNPLAKRFFEHVHVEDEIAHIRPELFFQPIIPLVHEYIMQDVD
jgi:ribosomal protein L37AE/L43A